MGAGAIGCLFASALHHAGGAVTLLLRDPSAKINDPEVPAQIATSTVVVQRQGINREMVLPVSVPGDSGAITHLLVTTKSYDARAAVASVAHRCSADTQVLLLTNGMGVADELHRDFPHLDLYYGTTTEGAYRLAPRHICHAGQGVTRIGKPGLAEPAPWFGQWSRAIDGCSWDANIDEALWLKVAINCAINPLTALHDSCNGALATRPALAQQVQQLCQEIVLISSAAGYHHTAKQLQKSVAGVIADTANNRSSMLQDIQAGRPTEIEYITGYLLTIAQRHNIAAPHNRLLLQRIRNLD